MNANYPHVPGELLSRLVGNRMYSVEFVLNDYVQFRFDGEPGEATPVTLNCYVWPTITFGGQVWREDDLGYADAVRKLVPGTVMAISEQTGSGISISLDTGSVVIRPTRGKASTEIAEIMGFGDGSWMVWRPGEDCFAHLI